MGAVPALSCITQNSKATAPTAPSAPQKDMDTTVPLAILMHTAQCHNHHAELAAGDAPPKEPMHKAQQDEPEEDTAVPLTNHTTEGHHHNNNESTVAGSSVPHQPTSSFNLRGNTFAPLTAIGSLLTSTRGLPTLLACALPFWKKDAQSQGQQQIQPAGQEQMTSSSGSINKEWRGSPSPPPASHANPDHSRASERAQSFASPVRTIPGSWRSSTPGTDAVPELSSSPVSSESSGSDTTLRPASPTNNCTNAVDTAIAPAVLQTAHHDVDMDSEENPHYESDSEDHHDAPSTTCLDHPTSPPAKSSRKSSPAPALSLYERSSDPATSADAPSHSPDSNASVPSTPTSPISPQSPDTHNPATTAAAAEEALPSPSPQPQPQPKRKRTADQGQGRDQTASAQMLSGLERFRARKRAKRAEREEAVDFQLEVSVPAGLRRGGGGGGGGGGVRGGKMRGLRGSVWEEWGEEKGEGEV